MTVVFLDLLGVTAFAETAEPEEVMGVLREYHGEMGKLIMEHEGTFERFTGDGMMIFFNDPCRFPTSPSARSGWPSPCASASTISHERGRSTGTTSRSARGSPRATPIGAIGFEGRWDCGAIGTVTNLAARCCGEAKGGQILVSSRVAGALEELIEAEEVGRLTLKGFLRAVSAFSLLRLR